MVDLGNIFEGVFSSIAKGAVTFFVAFAILIVVGIIGFFGLRWYKKLTFFKTPISLTILMENGMEKTRHDLRGGPFMNKGLRDFKVRIPRQKKPHIMGYMPDFSKSPSTDGRLYFITSGDRTIWQQYESSWVLKEQRTDKDKNTFEYDLLKKPVPREIKQITINAIKNWRDTVSKEKITAFGIAIGAFIIMVIAHLISLFIQTKIRCAGT